MKPVTAVIAPETFAAVKEALATFGIVGLTVSDVWALSRGCSRSQIYRGRTFRTDLYPHVRLDVIASDTDTDAADIVNIIVTVSAGRCGEGNMWTVPVQHLVRVRTGEAGVDAL